MPLSALPHPSPADNSSICQQGHTLTGEDPGDRHCSRWHRWQDAEGGTLLPVDVARCRISLIYLFC